MADLEQKVGKEKLGLADVGEGLLGLGLIYHRLRKHGWSRKEIAKEGIAAGVGVTAWEMIKQYGFGAYAKSKLDNAKDKFSSYINK